MNHQQFGEAVRRRDELEKVIATYNQLGIELRNKRAQRERVEALISREQVDFDLCWLPNGGGNTCLVGVGAEIGREIAKAAVHAMQADETRIIKEIARLDYRRENVVDDVSCPS